jgi:glycosyltransferase involved in cell wall biosynthesis
MPGPLRVGLNLTYLVADSGGSGRYARELIPALMQAEPGIELTAWLGSTAPADMEEEPWAQEVRWVRLPVAGVGSPWHLWYELVGIGLAARRRRLQVVHGLANLTPVIAPRVASVVTILDVIWMHHPETMDARARVAMRALAPLCGRASSRVIAISRAAAEDVSAMLSIPLDKFDVTPLGIAATGREELRGRAPQGVERALDVAREGERTLDVASHGNGHSYGDGDGGDHARDGGHSHGNGRALGVASNGSERAPGAERVTEIRARLGLRDGPIVLCVAAKRRHKNLDALIRAMSHLVERSDGARPLLVLPGTSTSYERELRELAVEVGVEHDVAFPDWIDEDELESLYAQASCFVLPSFQEGFGLPVLEAMSRGVPVACSDTSSLPEVAGDAALYFDPCDEWEIAAQVRRLLSDRALAQELAARGRARCEQFTWRRTAELTLDSYRRAIAQDA